MDHETLTSIVKHDENLLHIYKLIKTLIYLIFSPIEKRTVILVIVQLLLRPKVQIPTNYVPVH